MEAKSNEYRPLAHPILPPSIQQQETSQDHAEFLQTTSSAIPSAIPVRDIREGIDLPINAIEARYLRQQNKVQLENKFVTPGNQIVALNHASRIHESNEEKCHAPQQHSTVTVAVPGFPSGQYDNILRRKASSRNSITTRIRRARIAEGFKALRELLPHSEEDNEASMMDGVIDHVKYLQLQIKTMSQSRLGGEETIEPFIYLEGYGHYLLYQQQMLNESFEDVMGRLMEADMEAVKPVLESKGLYILPMALADHLFQA